MFHVVKQYTYTSVYVQNYWTHKIIAIKDGWYLKLSGQQNKINHMRNLFAHNL